MQHEPNAAGPEFVYECCDQLQSRIRGPMGLHLLCSKRHICSRQQMEKFKQGALIGYIAPDQQARAAELSDHLLNAGK